MDPLLGGVGGDKRQGMSRRIDKGVKRKQLTSSDSIKGINKQTQLAYASRTITSRGVSRYGL